MGLHGVEEVVGRSAHAGPESEFASWRTPMAKFSSLRLTYVVFQTQAES